VFAGTADTGDYLMSVRVKWGDPEQTVICYEFTGMWKREELFEAYQQARTMELSVKHRVDVMISSPGSVMDNVITKNSFILALLRDGRRSAWR
jgi:hypothetical protein